jgi:alpha-tubulin suppressor-like RCC1 family protein
LTGVAAIAVGGFHSCALKTDGVARCWGGNSSGELGDGSTTNRSNNVDVLGGPVFWK